MKRSRAVLGILALSMTLAGSLPQIALAAKSKSRADLLKADSTLNKSSYVVRVHGNAFVPEHTSLLLQDGIRRRGWGANFLAWEGASNWFHVPLPIYASGEKEAVRLKKVYLLFRSAKTIITDVHVWDGARMIKAYTKMNLSGDHGSKIDNMNQFVIDVPGLITSGLGISVGVSFSADGMINGQNVGEIIFVGAGAVYEK